MRTESGSMPLALLIVVNYGETSKRPEGRMLWKSATRLNEDFFNEIIRQPPCR